MNNFARITVIAAFALIGAAGCKPKTEDGAAATSLKTLDNFTRDDGTSVKTYFCGVKMTDELFQKLSAKDQKIADRFIEVPADRKDLKLTIAGALAAVPKPMQALFFATKGKIRVVDDVKSVCNDNNLSAAEKKFASEGAKDATGYAIEGCWTIAKGRLDIILPKDEKVIHHALLRLFTYVYTEFFAANIDKIGEGLNAETKADLAKASKRFSEQRYQLGVALLKDLYAKSAEKGKAWDELKKQDKDAFEKQTFSNVVDSAYCNPSSRAVFEKDFPATWKEFTEGQSSLLKDFGPPLY